MPREALWLAPQDRIKVLASLGALAGALALIVAFIAVFAAFTYPSDATAGIEPIYVGTINELKVGEPRFYFDRDFFVVKREDASVIALYMKDTHYRGCGLELRNDLLKYYEEQRVLLRDACTGDTFNQYGQRLFGPAPRSLDRFPVEVIGNKVYVRAVKQLLIRGRYW